MSRRDERIERVLLALATAGVAIMVGCLWAACVVSLGS